MFSILNCDEKGKLKVCFYYLIEYKKIYWKNDWKYFGFRFTPRVELSEIYYVLLYTSTRILIFLCESILFFAKNNNKSISLFFIRIVVKTYELITVPANAHSFKCFWWTFTFRQFHHVNIFFVENSQQPFADLTGIQNIQRFETWVWSYYDIRRQKPALWKIAKASNELSIKLIQRRIITDTYEIYFKYIFGLPIYLAVALLIAKANLGPIPSMHIKETNLNYCICVVTRLHHARGVHGTFVVPRTLMMGIRNVSCVTSMQIRMKPVVSQVGRFEAVERYWKIIRILKDFPNIHKRLILQLWLTFKSCFIWKHRSISTHVFDL